MATATGMDDDAVYAMLKESKSKKAPRKKGGNAGAKVKGMTEEEKRAAIRVGLARKKECERKALEVVERLIEPGVDKEWLRNSVRRNSCIPPAYELFPHIPEG